MTTIKPVTQEDVRNFLNKHQPNLMEKEFINWVACMKDRWAEEKEFENFNDYVTVIRKECGYPKLKVSKAFTLTHTEGRFSITVKISASGSIRCSAKYK